MTPQDSPDVRYKRGDIVRDRETGRWATVEWAHVFVARGGYRFTAVSLLCEDGTTSVFNVAGWGKDR